MKNKISDNNFSSAAVPDALRKSGVMYHGSVHSGLKILKPKINVIMDKPVIFATPDFRFALAMIHGTGDQIAVGYFIDKDTGKKEMYLDEIKPKSLNLLRKSGCVYEVSSKGFRADSRLMPVEFIKNADAKVLRQIKINDVLEELRKHDVKITNYGDLPFAMKKRKLNKN